MDRPSRASRPVRAHILPTFCVGDLGRSACSVWHNPTVEIVDNSPILVIDGLFCCCQAVHAVVEVARCGADTENQQGAPLSSGVSFLRDTRKQLAVLGRLVVPKG